MNQLGWTAWVLMAGLAAGPGRSQTPQPAGQGSAAQAPAQSNGTSAAAKRRAAARRKAAQARQAQTTPQVQVIPMETAPPSPPPSPAVQAKQAAADHKLLQQQEQQSAQAAQVTNQQVEQAQKQKDAIQNEVRIQDAPGPAQTGVVPGAGVPVAPVNVDDRIQDAPGPAQTLPKLPAPATQQPAPQL